MSKHPLGIDTTGPLMMALRDCAQATPMEISVGGKRVTGAATFAYDGEKATIKIAGPKLGLSLGGKKGNDK